MMDGWHSSLAGIVRESAADTISPFAVKTAVPLAPWATDNVTLLGDALHKMTRFRGIGANTALRDAAALRQALVKVDRGEAELISALAAYERDMIDYGFAAVRSSLRDMERFHTDQPLRRLAVRTLFRFVDRVPFVRRAMFRR
jgi:2-polyprenyl-6-methoxyphenol hydroxylase-like FAD-dependent oxidoreductase